MKNLTDIRETVETGVDPRLKCAYILLWYSATTLLLLKKPANELLLAASW